MQTAADGGQKLPPLLVIWGEAGIGKTSFALKHKRDAAVLAYEVGARTVGGTKVFPQEGTIQSWPESLTYLRALAHGIHPYKTVVLDSLTGMEAICLAYAVQQSGKGSFDKMGWGKESAVVAEFRMALELLERIKRRGIQVIITAHEKRKKNKHPILGDHGEMIGQTQAQEVWEYIYGWADVVGYASYNYGVVEGKLVKIDDTRRLHTIKGAGFDAKQRSGYEMASPIPLDWRSFVEALERGGDTAEIVVSRITALALDIGDSDVAARATKFVDDCKGDVGRLLELENALKLQKEKMK